MAFSMKAIFGSKPNTAQRLARAAEERREETIAGERAACLKVLRDAPKGTSPVICPTAASLARMSKYRRDFVA